MMTMIYDFVNDNERYIFVFSILVFFAILAYFFVSIRMKVLAKKENKEDNELINNELRLLKSDVNDLKNSVKNIEINDNNIDLAYTELSKIYDISIQYGEDLIHNDTKLIKFLFERFTIIVKVTNYLIETHKRQIKGFDFSKDVVINEIELAHQDIIASCIKNLGKEFSTINSNANAEILAHTKLDVLKILSDKKRNSKVNRLIENISILISKSIRNTIYEYRKFKPLNTAQSTPDNVTNIMFDIANNNPEAALSKLLRMNLNKKQKDQIILLQSQYTSLFDEKIEGTISQAEKDLAQNNLNIKILTFTQSLD